MCPGFALCQEQVIEAAQAADALKHNSLHVIFPGLENPLVEAALELKNAWAQYEAEKAEKDRVTIETGSR